MTAEICTQCGRALSSVKRRLDGVSRCGECQLGRVAAQSGSADCCQTLTVSGTPSALTPSTTTPEIVDLPLIGEDIQLLLADASAPIVPRSRTFGEWLSGADAATIDYQKKIVAGDRANALLRQRRETITEITLLAEQAATARRGQLESRLAEVKLQDEIATRLATRQARLQLAVMTETEKQRRLLKAAEPQPSIRERVLTEYREDRQARVQAADQMLADFLNEARLVCESRASIHERALRLRNLLDVFELDEESLPDDARWLLRTAERLSNGS